MWLHSPLLWTVIVSLSTKPLGRVLAALNGHWERLRAGGFKLLTPGASQVSWVKLARCRPWAPGELSLMEVESTKFQPVFVSHSVIALWCQGLQPTRFLCPWDSPGKNTGVGCHFLLQGIFPTQELNLGLLHCSQILYHLSHQGSLANSCWEILTFVWNVLF